MKADTLASIRGFVTRIKAHPGYTESIGHGLFLARDNNSPYDDERPLTNGVPEKREYMAIGVVGDEEVGQPSDIISVVFGG